MAERSPKHKLTLGNRGWYKRVGGSPKWICSLTVAPTGSDADRIFEERFKELSRPRIAVADLSIEDVFNKHLVLKRHAAESGSLSHRTVGDYIDAAQRFLDAMGKPLQASSVHAQHFSVFAAAIAAFSPHRRAKLVTIIRGIFKWATASGLIPGPVDFGPDLKIPRRAEFRLARREKGEQQYSPAEVGLLLSKATIELRALILMALNGGFGNTELSAMKRSDVDLGTGLIKYPRSKTGVERIVPMWPELVTAIEALPRRHPELLFINPENGLPWVNESGRSHNDRLAVAFARLCEAAGVPNRGFYSLRRTFRTLADEVGDQRAAAAIMGHDVGDIGSIYVQRISPERLKAVVDHVRKRLGIALFFRRRKRSAAGVAAKPKSKARAATAPKRRG